MGRALNSVFTVNGLFKSIRARPSLSQIAVYNEKAFRYLLEAEPIRSERSGYLYQVILVYRIDVHGRIAKMDSCAAKTVMGALSGCLRETDYIGWYREELVAGGVLTVVDRDAVSDVFGRLQHGFAESLRTELGVKEASRFEIRVFRHDELSHKELGKEIFAFT